MEQKLIEFKTEGFLDIKTVDGSELFHLTTPCRFSISDSIVADVKSNYKEDEQIGGLLWVKPTFKDGEIIHSIDKVSCIRNAIEDNTRAATEINQTPSCPTLKN